MKNRGILIAGGVVVAAIIAFVIYRSVAPAPAQPSPAPAPATTSTWPAYPHQVSDDELARHNAPRITPDELLPLYKSGAVTVVDVRDLDAFTAQHIPGALHMPLAQVESMLGLLPKGKTAVFYCT